MDDTLCKSAEQGLFVSIGSPLAEDVLKAQLLLLPNFTGGPQASSGDNVGNIVPCQPLSTLVL